MGSQASVSQLGQLAARLTREARHLRSQQRLRMASVGPVAGDNPAACALAAQARALQKVVEVQEAACTAALQSLADIGQSTFTPPARPNTSMTSSRSESNASA